MFLATAPATRLVGRASQYIVRGMPGCLARCTLGASHMDGLCRIATRSRRRFLEDAARLSVSAAGILLLAGCQTSPSGPVAASSDLETTRLKVVQTPSMCQSPQYVAQDLLRSEGFHRSAVRQEARAQVEWTGRGFRGGRHQHALRRPAHPPD